MPRLLRTRTGTFLTVALAALVIAACGASGKLSSGSGSGAPLTGKQIFSSAGCGSCHTLAAAGSHGAVGPNLDQLRPSVAAVVSQVTHGGGGMPSFGGQLSTRQIALVARFVYSATHSS